MLMSFTVNFFLLAVSYNQSFITEAGPISYADMAQNFLLEIEGRHLTMEDKIARLTQIRENITRYGCNNTNEIKLRILISISGSRNEESSCASPI